MNLEAHGKLPVGQWCLMLGKCSYPVYITHWLFLGLTFRVFGASHIDLSRHYLEFGVAALAVSLAGGVGAAYALDAPMQSLFKRILPARGVG
jgi:peptidoglycan/LPS O-acetylase OafA/YrhL